MSLSDTTFRLQPDLERLAQQTTWLHQLDPRAKLIALLSFTVSVMSFDPYALSAILAYSMVPLLLAYWGQIPLGFIAKRIFILLPFPLLMGLPNIWLESTPYPLSETVSIPLGTLSCATLLLRFALIVSVGLLCIATTGFNGLCDAMQRLGMPTVLVNQLRLLYRYLFVLLQETQTLIKARQLRSFGKRGFEMSSFISLLGQLLARSLMRAQTIHHAMLCRGFSGQFSPVYGNHWRHQDSVFVVLFISTCLLLRWLHLPTLMQQLLQGTFS